MTVPTATILHLSDLHLGKTPDDTGGKSKSSARSLIKYGGLTMQSHDPYIFATLKTNIRAAARRIGAPNDVFDFVVVTGDISTHSDPAERFKFAKQFLTASVSLASGYETGLSIATRSLLCVPGNHDKLGQQSGPHNYAAHFKSLPALPPFRHEVQVARSEQGLIFYGLDSNLYEEGNIAVGKITPETLGWLSAKLDEDEDRPGIKIVLLHHHPADLRHFRRLSFKKWAASVLGSGYPDLTRLEEGERLLELCRERVHLVLHGHEHFPIAFADKASSCVVISAGTASKWSSRRESSNSFHALRLDGLHLTVVQFDWNGSSFVATERWRLDLTRALKRASNQRL